MTYATAHMLWMKAGRDMKRALKRNDDCGYGKALKRRVAMMTEKLKADTAARKEREQRILNAA